MTTIGVGAAGATDESAGLTHPTGPTGANAAANRRRRRRLPAPLIIGATLLTLIVLLAVVAPLLWGSGAEKLNPTIRAHRSGVHPLGTDSLGRDVFYRTLVATRLTLIMAAAATILAVGIGTILGAGIVLAGRRVRSLGARVIDLMVSYPPVIVALAITAIFSPGRVSVVVAIGIAFSPQFARLINTLANSVSSKDYVTIARLLGLSRGRVLRRHVLPNIAAPVLVLTSVGFATTIVTLSGLSFIGLGVQQPSYDWGQLLASGLRDIYVNPIEALGPSLAILVTGLAAGLLGDGLAQFWDPRQQGSRSRRSARAVAASMPAVGESAEDQYLSDRSLNASRQLGEATVADRPVVASIRDLRVSASRGDIDLPLVRGVSLEILAGEIVGFVGESGSGKSVTAMAIARLLAPELSWSAKILEINGRDLSDSHAKPPVELASDIGIVFQDPSTCFNPALHVGTQITEVVRVHKKVPKDKARAMAIEKLREARVSSPETRLKQYPHELSGGMRQRAMIAMALLSSPKLLIADEPTTALDVTVQADVLRLLHQINRTHDMAILMISHDIKVISALCHRVCVMYAGRIVEELPVAELRAGRVQHPYTRALLAATPAVAEGSRERPLAPLAGRPPAPDRLPPGCSFVDRCPLAMPVCATVDPRLLVHGEGAVACHAVNEVPLRIGADHGAN
jgi:peptide/nickel transport system permease protein